MNKQHTMQPDSARVVRLTPAGRGAVTTLLVVGPGAVDMVDRLFHGRAGRRLAESSIDRIVVGWCGKSSMDFCIADEHLGAMGGLPTLAHISSDGQAIAGTPSIEDAGTNKKLSEEIVARRASATDVLLHCHGGTAAVERLETLLVEHGAVVQEWAAWASDAYEDQLQAEALEALAKATTQATASVLLDQYQGALRDKLNEITAAIARGDTEAANRELDRLIDRGRLGLHLIEPWKVVLAGPPNAGKSSLLNALVGYQRAIVHTQPGTTRDVLTAQTSIDGWPVELIDTAGLREGDDFIEAEGVCRAQKQMAAADLVLLVFDGSQSLTEQEQRLLKDVSEKQGSLRRLEPIIKPNPSCRVPGNEQSEGPVSNTLGHCCAMPQPPLKPVLVVHNKSDLATASGDRPEGIATSALTNHGIADLLRAISRCLVPNPPQPAEAIPWTRRQIDYLMAMRGTLVK